MDALWKRFGLMVVSTVIGSSLALVGATASSATDAVAELRLTEQEHDPDVGLPHVGSTRITRVIEVDRG